jgi:hypothetical protein
MGAAEYVRVTFLVVLSLRVGLASAIFGLVIRSCEGAAVLLVQQCNCVVRGCAGISSILSWPCAGCASGQVLSLHNQSGVSYGAGVDGRECIYQRYERVLCMLQVCLDQSITWTRHCNMWLSGARVT